MFAADPGLRAPSQLDTRELDREIGELAAHLAAATCRWLLLVAEFERRGGHEKQGFSCCAQWLSWRCGLERRSAFEHLRVARALGDLPKTRREFATGRLSYSKVRALCRVADAETESELVELARQSSAAQLERIVRGYRRAMDAGEALAIQACRYVSTSWAEDGTLRLNGCLPAEEGELLMRALDAMKEQLRRDRREAEAEGDDEPGSELRSSPSSADALVAVADQTIATGGGKDAFRSAADRHQVIVHIDLDDLANPETARSNASVSELGSIPPETAKRLACDAAIVSVIEQDGVPLSVGRKTRSIPPALRRALNARDRGCRFPGCGATKSVDAHHVRHWAEGGVTSLDNLVQLCRHHHRLVHEAGYRVEITGGRPTFRRRDGSLIAECLEAPAGSRRGCVRAARRSGARRIDAVDLGGHSRGEPFDLDLTVLGLMARRE